MRFVLDAEQRMFGETLRRLLADAGTAKIARGAAGDAGRGGRCGRRLLRPGSSRSRFPRSSAGSGCCRSSWPSRPRSWGARPLRALRGDARGGRAARRVAVAVADRGGRGARVAGRPACGGRRRHRPRADPGRRRAEGRRGARVARPGAAAVPRRGGGGFTDFGALLCAAQQVGVGQALLDVSVEYAKTRQQFGRPIGEYQAIKHHLASAMVELEFARPLVYGAALSYGTADFARMSPPRRSPRRRRPTGWPRPPYRCTARSATPTSTTRRCGSARRARCTRPGVRWPSTGPASSLLLSSTRRTLPDAVFGRSSTKTTSGGP